MKEILCKLFGHKPIIEENKCYCLCCGREGFMKKIDKEHGSLIEYGIDENTVADQKLPKTR